MSEDHVNKIEQLICDKVKLAVSVLVNEEPRELTAEALADFDVRVERVARYYAYRLLLSRHVLAVGQMIHRYPADWWQAVKARFAPAWALKRWPVEWAEFENWERVCPHHSSPHSGKKHIEWLAGYSEEAMF